MPRGARLAVAHQKPLVLVHEADVKHGGAELQVIMEECPELLRATIFDASREVICWRRTKDLQLCALRLIAEALLATVQLSDGAEDGKAAFGQRFTRPYATTKVSLERVTTRSSATSSSRISRAVSNADQRRVVAYGAGQRLYLPADSINRQPTRLTKPVLLVCSKLNAGAPELCQALVDQHMGHSKEVGAVSPDATLSFASIATERELEGQLKMAARTGLHVSMLLLLDRTTFSVEGEHSVLLANQIRRARGWGSTSS